MLVMLQRVTDALVEEAHRCRESTGNGDPISSDDLLPLLIAILIQVWGSKQFKFGCELSVSPDH